MILTQEHTHGVTISVRAQPGAKKNGVIGERAGALRVAVNAAPEKGKANEAIADVLAEALAVRSSQVVLIAGQTSRDKRFLITGIAVTELDSRLALLINS